MRLTSLVISVIALTLGIGHNVYATQIDFYPPERIDCKRLDGNQFRCEGFNRDILEEDMTNADLQRDREDTFFFVYALAYYNPSHQYSTVYYHYNNNKYHMVRLKTNFLPLHPDVTHGAWRKYEEGIYVCDNGYLACSITSSLFHTN